MLAEMVGGPACGEMLTLTDPPRELRRTVAVGDSGAITFVYKRNALLPRKSGAVAYEFKGYPKDVPTGA